MPVDPNKANQAMQTLYLNEFIPSFVKAANAEGNRLGMGNLISNEAELEQALGLAEVCNKLPAPMDNGPLAKAAAAVGVVRQQVNANQASPISQESLAAYAALRD
jgi:hypothetical protein